MCQCQGMETCKGPCSNAYFVYLQELQQKINSGTYDPTMQIGRYHGAATTGERREDLKDD